VISPVKGRKRGASGCGEGTAKKREPLPLERENGSAVGGGGGKMAKEPKGLPSRTNQLFTRAKSTRGGVWLIVGGKKTSEET